jgi:hypothetical protein
MRILSRRQAQATRDRIRPMIELLYRCRCRMEQLGFDRNGAIYRSFDQAYTAFLELNAELFCQAHGFTAAKPPPDPPRVTPAKDQVQESPDRPHG